MVLSKKTTTRIKHTTCISLACAIFFGGIYLNNLYAAQIATPLYDMSELTRTNYHIVPYDYVKPYYTIKVSDSNYKPREKDLTAAEAASIMSQEIYRIFDYCISGDEILLLFDKEGSNATKTKWIGRITLDSTIDSQHIYVAIDGVTGDLLTASFISYFDSKGAQCLDDFLAPYKASIKSNLYTNYQTVKELITEANLLHEPIKSIVYLSTSGGTISGGTPLETYMTGEHEFKVITQSGLVYHVEVSLDLLTITGLSTPSYLASLKG